MNSGYSLICPNNDLESREILDIAAREGLHICNWQPKEWGCRLSLDHINLNELRQSVIVVEMPGLEAEAAIRQSGRQLHTIDHHHYNGLDRRHPLSAIEQFCKLIGVELTRRIQHIAINDTQFIPGLCLGGASYDEMLEIRRQEHEVKHIRERYVEALNIIDQFKMEYPDVDLICGPERYSKMLLEAHQIPNRASYDKAAKENQLYPIKPVIILYEDKFGHICQVEVGGPGEEASFLDQIMSDSRLNELFDMWRGGSVTGFYFGAKPRFPNNSTNIDYLVTELLGLFMVTGRPIKYFGCTYFLPLEYRKAKPDQGDHKEMLQRMLENNPKVESVPVLEQKPTRNPKALAKERGRRAKDASNMAAPREERYEYFYSQFRDSVLSNNKNPENALLVSRWRLNLDHPDCSHIQKLYGDDVCATIRDVSLYLNVFGNVILAISVENTASPLSQTEDANPWWAPLFDISLKEVMRDFPINRWLKFATTTRSLYPYFEDQSNEGKIGPLSLIPPDRDDDRHNEEDKSSGCGQPKNYNVIISLLEQMVGPPYCDANSILESVTESRMFCQTSYVLSGKIPRHDTKQMEQFERLFSLGLFADYEDPSRSTFEEAGNWASDRKYTVDNLLPEHTFRRWQEINHLAGFTGFSSSWMGFGEFFESDIAPDHVHNLYGFFQIHVLFNQATLSHFDQQITTAAEGWIKETNPSRARNSAIENEFATLRKQFIHFTNFYWFLSVTPQVQGKEVYNHQVKALDLKLKYEYVKEKIDRTES